MEALNVGSTANVTMNRRDFRPQEREQLAQRDLNSTCRQIQRKLLETG
jgi:hypothetical protein